MHAYVAAYGTRIVPGFFHRRARQLEPVPQEMNPQDALKAHRRVAHAFGFGVKRINDLAPATPGNNLLHLVEKLVPAGRLAMPFKAFVSESLLAHSTNLRVA